MKRRYFIRWWNANSHLWVLVQHEYTNLTEADSQARALAGYFNTQTDILCTMERASV